MKNRLNRTLQRCRKYPSAIEDPKFLGDGKYSTALGKGLTHATQKWTHFPQVYDSVINSWCQKHPQAPLRVLEIGVQHGGSLEIWGSIAGEAGIVVGVDSDQRCKSLTIPNARVVIASQNDGVELNRIVDEMGGVDIVVDDGSHRGRDQWSSLTSLWSRVNAGGFYIIEDTHTSYYLQFGGGWRLPGTAISRAKSLVDYMHGRYHRVPKRKRQATIARDLESIKFVDSMIVLEKRLLNSDGYPFVSQGKRLY